MHSIPNLGFIFIITLFTFSCVSKKKHLATIDFAQSQSDSLQANIDSTTTVIGALRLQLAEEKGANRALLATQDKMQDRIINLDDEIERLSSEAENQVESMDGRIQAREKEIASLKARISNAKSELESRDTELETLAIALKDTLQSVDSTTYTVQFVDGQLVVSLLSDFLFYSGSTTKMHSEGEAALEYISQVVLGYPRMEIEVVGHTNNTSLRRSSIKSKWAFSAMRAATLVHRMTRQYDLNTNRIIASGKGEFAPRASNTTEEGRKQNDRIEIFIFPNQASLKRDIKRILD
ncbi:MAG: OmpA family protein [Chitinophagales bacterium]|nr:OmpA family protein [Chitinophagales bacterium]